MTDLAPSLDRAIELYRRGDSDAARREAEAALSARPRDGLLLHFLGTLCCRGGAFEDGIAYLNRAITNDPTDARSRLNLAMAHLARGRTADALGACQGPLEAETVELGRLRGQLLQQLGRDSEAAATFERVVEAVPGDWEIWNNLGNARRNLGDKVGAIAALERAVSIRPDVLPVLMNLGAACAEAGRLDEAIDSYRQASALAPAEPSPVVAAARLLGQRLRFDEALRLLERAGDSVDVRLERARALSGLRRLDDADEAYRAILHEQPDLAEGWLELGIVLERAGRLEELPAVVSAAGEAGVPADELAYLRALLLDREGHSRDALDLLSCAPDDLEPARTQRLMARLADKLDEPALAFAAASRANTLDSEVHAGSTRAAAFRSMVQGLLDTMAEPWCADWPRSSPSSEHRPPAFLVGFPRSGTTLLDTMLMGHPKAQVLEEIPLIGKLMSEIGAFERIAKLDEYELDRLRNLYFHHLREADRSIPDGAAVIDKMPFNLLAAPLIYRLFPDAPILFALRHPCDVMLSCFMQGFEMNDAVANFLDLEDSARLYDLVMTFWQRCLGLLPLRVHNVRYEELVVSPEAELRAVIDFLGLPWADSVLDHQRSAAARGVISSPSYYQVTRPIYREASGRWRRYLGQLAPVLPVLLPWAERLGYREP